MKGLRRFEIGEDARLKGKRLRANITGVLTGVLAGAITGALAGLLLLFAFHLL